MRDRRVEQLGDGESQRDKVKAQPGRPTVEERETMMLEEAEVEIDGLRTKNRFLEAQVKDLRMENAALRERLHNVLFPDYRKRA